jgi:hypothetical protein
LRGPSASEHRRISVPAPARVSVSLHVGFSHRRDVLRPLFRTLHSLLGHQRSSACFRPVCLSSVCLSLFCRSACASFPRLVHPPSIDRLDSELWYSFGCRAAALASATPWPLGSLFGSFHHAERAPRVISSLTAESPTIRSFKTILRANIGILTTRILRARKTRKRYVRAAGTLALFPGVLVRL